MEIPFSALIPFIIQLLFIAIAPLIIEHWWEKNRNKLLVSLVLSTPVVLFMMSNNMLGNLEHQILADYLPFGRHTSEWRYSGNATHQYHISCHRLRACVVYGDYRCGNATHTPYLAYQPTKALPYTYGDVFHSIGSQLRRSAHTAGRPSSVFTLSSWGFVHLVYALAARMVVCRLSVTCHILLARPFLLFQKRGMD